MFTNFIYGYILIDVVDNDSLYYIIEEILWLFSSEELFVFHQQSWSDNRKLWYEKNTMASI